MSKTAVALRHVHFEDLGSFEALLTEAGFAIRYCDVAVEDPSCAENADLLVILGGPIGANQDDDYPFLRTEIGLIASRISAGKPTLGICLGAQLMARALGARVYPGRAAEIGWKPINLTSAGKDLLGPLQDLPVLHWHGDTFDLPDGAVNLASTDDCDHQAFIYRQHALAFQFHPEATMNAIELWLVAHASEISATPGIAVSQLRADTRRLASSAEKGGRRALQNWLFRLF